MTRRTERPVVAWDVDDVLNCLLPAWLEEVWNDLNPQARRELRDLAENPPHALLGITVDAYRDSLDAFRLRRAADLAPQPEVLRWFHEHGELAHHVAITSTSLVATPVSAAWVMRHFGRWIRTVMFVPSHRPASPCPQYDRTKVDALTRMGGADVLIDDTPVNLEGARERGMAPILWPAPWNSAGAARTSIEATLAGIRAAMDDAIRRG